ncbi:hypothetical protein TIFTF001_033228 [Ficus carica]|uniref:F-box domain-containing protein n=1 Tax=Ficus carica TaxID=3494 RepID=A0AA88DYH2_FICCA|nr:hypothetical protein TIFTF001_033228 [Ficus carica]
MATKKRKHRKGMEQDKEPETVFEDRISELPEAIIIHILSFLPTLNAVRTSLLSKRWRHMWTSVPAIDICDSRDIPCLRRRDEGNSGRKKFYNFVDMCLKHQYADTTISKFRLSVNYYGGSSRVDDWLRFLGKKTVQELELHVLPMKARYCLPHSIINFRSLTLIKLTGLALVNFAPTSLPSLKELCLSYIQMDDRVLNNLLLSCIFLETLQVHYCYGLVNPKVSSLSLESLDFKTGGMTCYCHTLEVEAINLHSFAFEQSGGSRSKKCDINLVHCSRIRNLSLSKAFLTDQWFKVLIPQLPHLESLKLKDCYGFQHIKIWNQNLRNFDFTLHSQWDSPEATIDAPNLAYFCYTGYSLLKISVNAPNLLDIYIEVTDHIRKTYDVAWYTCLIEFLSEFNSSKNVSVFCCNEKALIIPDELKKMHSSPLPDLKHMKVKTGSRPFRKAMLQKSLLWIAPSNLEKFPF